MKGRTWTEKRARGTWSPSRPTSIERTLARNKEANRAKGTRNPGAGAEGFKAYEHEHFIHAETHVDEDLTLVGPYELAAYEEMNQRVIICQDVKGMPSFLPDAQRQFLLDGNASAGGVVGAWLVRNRQKQNVMLQLDQFRIAEIEHEEGPFGPYPDPVAARRIHAQRVDGRLERARDRRVKALGFPLDLVGVAPKEGESAQKLYKRWVKSECAFYNRLPTSWFRKLPGVPLPGRSMTLSGFRIALRRGTSKSSVVKFYAELEQASKDLLARAQDLAERHRSIGSVRIAEAQALEERLAVAREEDQGPLAREAQENRRKARWHAKQAARLAAVARARDLESYVRALAALNGARSPFDVSDPDKEVDRVVPVDAIRLDDLVYVEVAEKAREVPDDWVGEVVAIQPPDSEEDTHGRILVTPLDGTQLPSRVRQLKKDGTTIPPAWVSAQDLRFLERGLQWNVKAGRYSAWSSKQWRNLDERERMLGNPRPTYRTFPNTCLVPPIRPTPGHARGDRARPELPEMPERKAAVRSRITQYHTADGRTLAIDGRWIRDQWLPDPEDAVRRLAGCGVAKGIVSGPAGGSPFREIPYGCDVPVCPHCMSLAGAMRVREWEPIVSGLIQAGFPVVHLTLTQPRLRTDEVPVYLTAQEVGQFPDVEAVTAGGVGKAVPGEVLNSTVGRLAKSLLRLTHDWADGRAFWERTVVAGLVNIESTGRVVRNKGQKKGEPPHLLRWHTHTHLLLVLRKGTPVAVIPDEEHPGKVRIAGPWWDELVALWQRVTVPDGGEVIKETSEWAQKARPVTLSDSLNVVREVLKYPFKFTELTAAQFAEVLAARKGMRPHDPLGAFHGNSEISIVVERMMKEPPEQWERIARSRNFSEDDTLLATTLTGIRLKEEEKKAIRFFMRRSLAEKYKTTDRSYPETLHVHGDTWVPALRGALVRMWMIARGESPADVPSTCELLPVRSGQSLGEPQTYPVEEILQALMTWAIAQQEKPESGQ